MRIKKLCTYENIQLENADGTRPKGSWARLQKTFIADHFDMQILPGIGVRLVSKEDECPCAFVIPFANIPYIVTELEHDATTTEAHPRPVRRRARRPAEVPAALAEESEDSSSQWD